MKEREGGLSIIKRENHKKVYRDSWKVKTIEQVMGMKCETLLETNN